MIPNTKFGSLWTTPWPDKSSIFLIIEKAKNSIFSIEIRTFFLWNLGGPFFCRRVYLTWGYSIPSLVWFEQLLDPMKKPIFKIPFSRNSKSSLWNTNFFPRQAIPKILFVLHSNYTGDTPCRVWFDLDKSLTRSKRPFFKILFSRNSKSSVWKTNFFPRQAIPIFFLFYILITLVILHSKFGLIWTASWPDKKDLFLKFFIWKHRKFLYEKQTFFLGKLYKKFFLLYTFIILVIPNTKFGSLWKTPWHDNISIFLNRKSEKFDIRKSETDETAWSR